MNIDKQAQDAIQNAKGTVDLLKEFQDPPRAGAPVNHPAGAGSLTYIGGSLVISVLIAAVFYLRKKLIK